MTSVLSATDSDRIGLRWGRHTPGGRAVAAMWTVLLVAPLIGDLGDHRLSTVHIALVVAAATVFATMYLALVVPSSPARLRWPRWGNVAVAIAFYATTTFLVLYDRPSWAYQFCFCVIPGVRTWPERGLFVVALTAGLAIGLAYAAGWSAGNLVGPASITVGVGVTALTIGRLVQANEALRRAHDEQARLAVAEERLRFSRDLHDLLGHSLSVITLKAEVASRLLPNHSDGAATEVAQIEQVARQALREVREAVSGYRQATLAVELAAARVALAAAAMSWQEDVAALDVAPEVEATLAWTVREGVTNVIRHSRATSCTIRVMADPEEAMAAVVDNGVGVDAATSGGCGLSGLAERVAKVGGSLEAGPRAGGGFRLRVSVPIPVGSPPSAEAEPLHSLIS